MYNPQDDEEPEWPRMEGSYIAGHWQGEHSLPRSFWLNYVVTSMAIGAIVMILFFALFSAADIGQGRIPDGAVGFFAFAMIVGSVVGIWQLVGMWRSAANCKRHTGRMGWATVVQIIVVLGWLGFIVNAIDLISAL